MKRLILPIVASVAIGSILVNVLVRKPPLWEDASDCEIARFALERYGSWAGRSDLASFVEPGFAITRYSSGQIALAIVHTRADGSEDGTEFHLKFNRTTGGILEMRMGEAPESIRKRSTDLSDCFD